MWARVTEFMLGVWLAISPFVFEHAEDNVLLWASDLGCATLVATFACLSYWRPTRYAHLLTLVIAVWLVGFGRFGAASPPPPGMQNDIVVGLLLMMFAIVPNNASQPPPAWFRERAGALFAE
ncbi:MAG: hypothetical protein DWQ37_02975 [Planctomycetota bacterium]|nr:MAG: hypothetical protein DWQ37_02975 [Planctomycetota bacterium]